MHKLQNVGSDNCLQIKYSDAKGHPCQESMTFFSKFEFGEDFCKTLTLVTKAHCSSGFSVGDFLCGLTSWAGQGTRLSDCT